MTAHAQKQFNGTLYKFEHLAPMTLQVPIQEPPGHIGLFVSFSHHCFTEDFNADVHQDHHRYVYTDARTQKIEVRAFDETRHECSLQLPAIVQSMVGGRIYRSQDKYTYVAQIQIESATGVQAYSVFFTLAKDSLLPAPAARMYVASAYLKPLASTPNAQTWRFKQLVGEISGAFPPKGKKPKPSRKK